MKWLWLVVFLTFPMPVQAAFNEQLRDYLQDIGWTVEQLEQYLAKWNKKVSDFPSVEALKKQLGTPLTPERLHDVLKRRALDQEEAEALLGQFGEQLHNYTFVEDLEYALSFYSERYEAMQAMVDVLSLIGMTEDEMYRLFDRTPLTKRDALKQLDERIHELMLADRADDWDDVWREWLAAYGLRANVYAVYEEGRMPISLERAQARAASLAIELYDERGELVADLFVPEQRTSTFLLDAAEQLVHIGTMASDLQSGFLAARLPKTASPYPAYMLFGAMMIALGWLVAKKRCAKLG